MIQLEVSGMGVTGLWLTVTLGLVIPLLEGCSLLACWLVLQVSSSSQQSTSVLSYCP